MNIINILFYGCTRLRSCELRRGLFLQQAAWYSDGDGENSLAVLTEHRMEGNLLLTKFGL